MTTSDAILIGSEAIGFFIDPPREPSDIDYAVYRQDMQVSFSEQGRKIEALFNPVLFDNRHKRRLRTFSDHDVPVLDMDGLLTLKLSHAVGWPINWDKHVFDAQWLMWHGAKVDMDLFHDLYAFWKTLHGEDKRSDLDMSAEQFFDNNIEDSAGHDARHEALSAPLEPAYKQMLVGEVLTDMSLFDRMPESEKLRSNHEEVMNMAWERYRKTLPERAAYLRMLKSYILRHAPVEQSLWMLQNYTKMRNYSKPFYQILDEFKRSRSNA